MTGTTARRRAGFTLMEILVALAIIAALAAVIAPNVIGALDRARISSAHKTLQGLSQGIRDFRQDVGEYPQTLTQLSTPITTADRNACFALYAVAEVNRWRGPYVSRTIEASGVPIGVGTAANLLFWNTTTLILPNINVDVQDAIALDEMADGGDGASTGSVTWVNLVPPAEIVVMAYNIPIQGC